MPLAFPRGTDTGFAVALTVLRQLAFGTSQAHGPILIFGIN